MTFLFPFFSGFKFLDKKNNKKTHNYIEQDFMYWGNFLLFIYFFCSRSALVFYNICSSSTS